MGCTGLKEVRLPSTVEWIPHGTFANCNSMESMVLPKSLKRLDREAFIPCHNLKSIYFEGNAQSWDKMVGQYETINAAYPLHTRVYFYSATKPTTDGNYWRYVDNVPTPW